MIILLTAYQKAALYSTSDAALYSTATVNNRPMTDDDYKRIEQNLAEEVRRKTCPPEAQAYDDDYYHFSNMDNAAPGMHLSFKSKAIIRLSLDPSESMFRSIRGMSQSIDLQSSYSSSSRLDTVSLSSKKSP